MKLVARLHAASSVKRLFGSAARSGSLFGYECSQYADLATEKTILEKSLRSGCNTLVTRGSGSEHEIYEFLFDLSDNDDCNLLRMKLGHVTGGQRGSTVQSSLHELQAISDVLQPTKRGLDFVSWTLPAKADWSIASVGSVLEQLQKEVGDEGNDVEGIIGARVGLDLSTACLSTLSEQEVDKLWRDLVLPLSQKGLVSTLTIATNLFTHTAAAQLYQLASLHNRSSANSIETIATEVLRTHRARPGLLSGGYPFGIPHRMAGGSTSANGPQSTAATGGGTVIDIPPPEIAELAGKSAAVKDGMQRVQLAADDFKMALDRCIHAEKAFLSKVSDALKAKVPVTDVCLAHVLSNTYSQFQSPEEWQFVLGQQIEPKLEKGLRVLGGDTSTADIRDWTSLYQPMSKYLLSSFRHFLQERALLQSLEVQELLCGHAAVSAYSVDGRGADPVAAHLPGTLARFAAAWSGADHVLVAHNQVNGGRWSADGAVNGQSTPLAQAQVAEVYASIGRCIADVSA